MHNIIESNMYFTVQVSKMEEIKKTKLFIEQDADDGLDHINFC